MDSISPLAKILAEANGIDWRSIQGSGAGGSIVEQDILNYLSRVMSGDEEPPATPVDEAPPGWTGEMPPMPVAAAGLEALSAAGVESDITDFVAQQAQAAQPQAMQAQVVQPQVVQAQVPQPVVVQPFVAQLSTLEPVAVLPTPEPFMGMPLNSAPALPAATLPPVFTDPVAPVAAQADPDADLEFELDDLEDDQTDDDLMGSDLELDAEDETPEAPVQPPAPAYEPVAAYEPAPVYEPAPALAAHGSAFVEPQAPQALYTEQPAYDPVALDEDADFVLADEQPAVVAESVAAEAQAVRAEPPAGEAAGAGGAVAGGAAAFGLGGFLSRLYGSKAEPEVSLETAPAALPEVTIGSAHSEVTVLAEPVLGEALVSQAPPIPDTPVAAPLVADQWRDQELTGPELPELALTEPPYTDLPEAHEAEQHQEDHAQAAEARPAPELPTPEVFVPEQPILEQPAPEAVVQEQASSSWTDVIVPAGGAVTLAGAAGIGAVHLAADEHEHPAAEAVSPEPEPFNLEPVHPELGEPVIQAGVPAAAPVPEPVPVAVSQPVAASAITATTSTATVSTATTLRLNVELGVLETARAQLSTALVREVPLSLLVARAAARSLGTLGLHTGQGGVALANHAGQPMAADLSADIRISLEGLGRPAEGHPALLVLDAAELGLDELHRGECSLSVGRSGTNGAALSLRGDLDPARGARFLHEVAGLLNTPMLLLF